MTIKTLSALLAAWLLCGLASAQRPSHDGKVVLFGNLHAHSKLSDDIEGAGNDMLPAKAFEYAHQNGLDFLAITDHHKAADSNHRLWMTPTEYQTKILAVAQTYNQGHPGAFIAIPGIEWGNTSTGNHVNVLGAQQLPPDDILDADYNELFDWAAANAAFVNLNHPNSWKGSDNRNDAVGNYGQKLYPTTSDFISALGKTVRSISIISTVRGGHITGQFAKSTAKTHREMQWENYYKDYLNMGLRVSPAANQDTHWKNWGTVTAARTAAWADSASYDDLMAAFKANRVYATEDDELVVAYQVEYGGNRYWMGETVPLQATEADVELLVKVWQGPGTGADPTDEGPFEVEVISDSDGIGGHEAAPWGPSHLVASGTELRIPLRVVSGEYIYVHVVETGGKDNLVGDGEDIHVNATGASGPDGKRDDPNDSAWSSPVWFEFGLDEEEPEFIWSVHSGVYHDENCWAVALIGSANKRSGSPPAGKTKHNCHP